jgi:hypothetical protein
MKAKENTTQTVTVIGDALHTIRDTCVMLSVGATKCWELIGTGQLEAVRLGGRCTRVKKSSIDRLIQNGVAA